MTPSTAPIRLSATTVAEFKAKLRALGPGVHRIALDVPVVAQRFSPGAPATVAPKPETFRAKIARQDELDKLRNPAPPRSATVSQQKPRPAAAPAPVASWFGPPPFILANQIRRVMREYGYTNIQAFEALQQSGWTLCR